ncbi:methyl-accepting chemotaxis sensory transducer [Burkholderia seminalis]|nr:methyl-accepting chemotaxis sensory transducer [Burkholderia seminalis]
MGSMTVGRKLGVAFGIVVLISLIGSAISIVNFLKLNQANGWNVHSYQVLRANDDMLTSMVNMETGVRGYVASGDDRFLEPYKAGVKQFAASLDVVRGLTADNAAQQRRLETLRDMHRKVAEIDDKLIAMRRDVNAGTQPANVLIDYFKQGNDKQFMDRYRAVAAELNEAEQSLLDQRSGEVASLTALTKLTLAAAGVITVVLSIVLGTVITRGIMRSLGGRARRRRGRGRAYCRRQSRSTCAGRAERSRQPDGVARIDAAATERHRVGNPVDRGIDHDFGWRNRAR